MQWWADWSTNISANCFFTIWCVSLYTLMNNLEFVHFSLFCFFIFFFLSLSLGIASMVRLLSSAGEESQPGLTVLLCEILTAVFLSLFVHGMASHSSPELFRIMAHPLSSKLWVAVFGGGARTPVIEKLNSPARTPPPGECLCVLGIFFSLSLKLCISVC